MILLLFMRGPSRCGTHLVIVCVCAARSTSHCGIHLVIHAWPKAFSYAAASCYYYYTRVAVWGRSPTCGEYSDAIINYHQYQSLAVIIHHQ